MKKFLLFLSCFLATWCSVQAANPQITSATYNESTSQFYVNCTSGNNLYIDVICMKTGPVLSKVNINTYKTIDLPITSRPGEYDLVLYANGTPCHDKKVTVTQYGHINNITNISTSSVTVNYSMFHAEYPNNCYLKIGNYKHNITNVENGSYTWSGLNLTEGQTYTCEIYVDGVRKDTYNFKVIGPTFANSIRKLTPMGNRLKIDFTLRDTGVDVRFRVTVGSLTGYKGETFYYDYGPCDQHEGTCEVSVPYYTGQVIYAAELFVNGSNVNGNSTQAYNR